MSTSRSDDRYGDNEAQARFHKALKGAFAKPHVPQKAMRKGIPSQSKEPKKNAASK